MNSHITAYHRHTIKLRKLRNAPSNLKLQQSYDPSIGARRLPTIVPLAV